MPAGAHKWLYRLQRRTAEPIDAFLQRPIAGGVALFVMTVVAMVWANVSPTSYHHAWETRLSLGVGTWVYTPTIHFAVNDILMTVFFLLVGMEIKREMVHGELSTVRRASLPVIAALGGMIGPAVIYYAVNHTAPYVRGAAVPTATDIAFAVGVLMALDKRVPAAARVFLLALAVADDLGAVVIINAFYSAYFHANWMLLVVGGLALSLVGRFSGIRSGYIYVLPGVVVWIGLHHAGLHPTLAGVLIAFTIPAKRTLQATRAKNEVEDLVQSLESDEAHEATSATAKELTALAEDMLSPLERMEMYVHSWVTFAILPLFALVNAGVTFSWAMFAPERSRVSGGIAVALLFGKPLGIVMVTAFAVWIGITKLPKDFGRKELFLTGILGGIGFTMANFTAELAFADSPLLLGAAKLGIVAGSLLAAVIGYGYGRTFEVREGGATNQQAESSDDE